jgi:hypothetical protein
VNFFFCTFEGIEEEPPLFFLVFGILEEFGVSWTSLVVGIEVVGFYLS